MASRFSGLIRRFKRAPDSGAELPIREELYSIERLEQYALALAAEHQIAEKPQRVSLLLPRLEENGRKLIAAYKALWQLITKPFYWEKTSHGLSTATPHPVLPMTGPGSEQQVAESEG